MAVYQNDKVCWEVDLLNYLSGDVVQLNDVCGTLRQVIVEATNGVSCTFELFVGSQAVAVVQADAPYRLETERQVCGKVRLVMLSDSRPERGTIKITLVGDWQ